MSDLAFWKVGSMRVLGGWLFLWKGSLERDPQVMCKNMLVAGRVLASPGVFSHHPGDRP